MPLTRCNLYLPQTSENTMTFTMYSAIICILFVSHIVNLEHFIHLVQSRQAMLLKLLSYSPTREADIYLKGI